MPAGPLVLIAGPTASGKSAVASLIAEEFAGVIINADSMQVYRELRILTARPTAAEEAALPHRLYGHVPASEGFTVGRWLSQAIEEIEAAWRSDRLPIVVGGTGLYFRALTEGLAEIPDVPEPVLQMAKAERQRLGAAAFHGLLAACDPKLAGRIPPTDTQRAIRGVAVHRATGRALSEWQADTTPPDVVDCALTFVLDPPRPWLYERCDRRFDQMISDGALAEVEQLVAAQLNPDLPATKALGVSELCQLVRGEVEQADAIAEAKTRTRRYAKRQYTWFRNQIRNGNSVFAQDMESYRREIFPKIFENLLTRQK